MRFLELLNAVPLRDWIRFGFFFVGIVVFIAIAEKTRSALRWSPEVTRKLVHICTGILIFFTPFFFESNIPLIVMALLFIAVNYAGVRTGKLQGMHGTSRKSYGTVFYPLSFFVLVTFCWNSHKILIMIPILILALADAGAAIVGENLKQPHVFRWSADKKSIEGSVAMFVISLIVVLVCLPLLGVIDGYELSWAQAAWIGFVTATGATVLEALSSKGSDNFTAPLGAAFILHFMLTKPSSANLLLTVGLGLAGIVALGSYFAHFLTAGGSAATFLLAMLIFGTGGWAWSIPILTFFILSSLLSKFGKVHKSKFSNVFEKASRRDLGQVIANGGVAALVLSLAHFFPSPQWYPIYLGSLAAVNADTWATEIGVLSTHSPRSIVGFHSVPPGTSGGITLIGSMSALAGSAVIAASGWLVSSGPGSFWVRTFCFVSAAGLLASFVDSLLGATVQAQYRCPVCEKVTEKRFHCDHHETNLIKGFRWLNNDGVNVACALSGALLVWIGTNLF